MNLKLRNEGDAREIVERFNSFHDAFVKEFSAVSLYRYSAKTRGSSIRTGTEKFDVTVDFFHSNYEMGEWSGDRIVRAKFFNAEDILLDFSLPQGRPGDRSIDRLEIVTVQNRGPEAKAALHLFVTWNVLIDREWRSIRSKILQFERAEFDEI